MDMSKEEVAAIMSLAKKIIQHQNDKQWLQDLQDESVDTPNDLEVLRKSEDQHDMTGRPGPGSCGCHDEK
tara:strand:+ start:111 stop:320 length:210 start_codon:yes stop_codon:yes gene_type:complete